MNPKIKPFLLLGVFIALVVGGASNATAGELAGWLAMESRVFPMSAIDPIQHETNLSLLLRPEFYQEWNRGRQSVVITPLLRLDQGDPERTHFDLREAFFQSVGSWWEVRAGVRKVFWGVTESQHLVDIINQTDLIEDPDGEEKLGQPMVDISMMRGWGALELYLLIGFRERTFPGAKGRFRPGLPIGGAIYQSPAGRSHLDWAARWSHSLGMWDIALSHFAGTSRDPRFLLSVSETGSPYFIPLYEQIHQSGLELQTITGGWLWKLEAIYRTGQGAGFGSFTGGFEYTFVGAFGSRADVGILAEYLYDGRGKLGQVPFDDDIFVGSRVVLNDVQGTEMLAGAIFDRLTSTTLLRFEASRRIGDRWRLSLDARTVLGASPTDPLYSFRRDGFLQLEIARYF